MKKGMLVFVLVVLLLSPTHALADDLSFQVQNIFIFFTHRNYCVYGNDMGYGVSLGRVGIVYSPVRYYHSEKDAYIDEEGKPKYRRHPGSYMELSYWFKDARFFIGISHTGSEDLNVTGYQVGYKQKLDSIGFWLIGLRAMPEECGFYFSCGIDVLRFFGCLLGAEG